MKKGERVETRVLIIGGGTTGTGIARDLALRGIDSILVEKGDINAGASGANHGLLHSGARYAVTDPVSARECREESRLLKRLAPHCIEETGGLFVALPGDDENYIADFPASCKKSGIEARALDIHQALGMEPGLSPSIIAAYGVDDASINPFRLSVDNMAHAEALGARFLRHIEITAFERSGDRIERVHLRNGHTGEKITIEAEQVVSATGAWAGVVAAAAGIDLRLRIAKGSLLVSQGRVTDRVVNRLRAPSDADIIVPGGTTSIIGTTSVPLTHPDHIAVSFQEVDLLVAEASKMVPELGDCRYIRSFAGVRSLDGSGGTNRDDRTLSRSFIVNDHERDGLSNFISVYGGKLTTFRLMAEKAADLVCKRLGVTAPCLTRDVPLPPSEIGRWIEPHEARASWLRQHDPSDTLICECEMIPRSAVDSILSYLAEHRAEPDFKAISLRSRVGKGSCQGAFCAYRICGYLYNRGIIHADAGLEQLRAFLEERWHGLRPVLWGRQLAQEQLQEAIHCGMFCLELP